MYKRQDAYSAYPNNPASNENNVLIGSPLQILDPGIPEVREFIIDTCLEIVENYDVDAIHFDDYFYADGIDCLLYTSPPAVEPGLPPIAIKKIVSKALESFIFDKSIVLKPELKGSSHLSLLNR